MKREKKTWNKASTQRPNNNAVSHIQAVNKLIPTENCNDRIYLKQYAK